ncbi:heme exporter protein CcmD [Alloalcanivorax sp. C16-2]|uniref:heme exporter protein CcmD n=1 Tax=Alloalcanivorax TaxID=3020832 RepID=UPI00193139D5|nr:heme exporter protein CcmD [Alloalcanivorax marinus]MBL7249258.1 heme exporter protein CcmD [Alloalcanivorax marinus]
MYFDSFADFLAMGRHGFYVWTAYGLSALLITANMLLALRQQGRVRAELARRARRDARDNATSSEHLDESGS